MPFAPHFAVYYFVAYRAVVHRTRKHVPEVRITESPYENQGAHTAEPKPLPPTRRNPNTTPHSLRTERHIPILPRTRQR